MELITEFYHYGYQPKLRIDNYAYYVDDTNKDIVYKIASHYLSGLPDVNVEHNLTTYDLYIKQASLVYFGTIGLTYSGLTSMAFDNTNAVDKYTVIKIKEPQSLISMD